MLETSFAKLDSWTASVNALAANIESEYRKLRKDGVCGMGRDNLRQIVSTKGVTVAPNAFERCFDQALERANVPSRFFR